MNEVRAAFRSQVRWKRLPSRQRHGRICILRGRSNAAVSPSLLLDTQLMVCHSYGAHRRKQLLRVAPVDDDILLEDQKALRNAHSVQRTLAKAGFRIRINAAMRHRLLFFSTEISPETLLPFSNSRFRMLFHPVSNEFLF